MFSRQIGAFAQMYGIQGVPKPFVDALIRVFTNCSQTLEHRGDVIINGDTITNITTTATAEMLWAVATGNWTNNTGNDSYVDCDKASDRAGTLTSGSVRVYLPRSSGSDPNVRTGDVIGYLLDAAGDAIVATDVNDDPIGTIKLWDYDPADLSNPIPGGWTEATELQGLVPVGFKPGDSRFDPIDTTGGSETEAPHDPFETDLGGDVATSAEQVFIAVLPAGGTSVALGGVTNSVVIEGTVEGRELYITGYGTAPTSTAYTGITVDAHASHTHAVPLNALGAGSGGVLHGEAGSPTTGESPTLTHNVIDPGHVHSVDVSDIWPKLSIYDNPHSHAFYGSEHYHTFSGVIVSMDEHIHPTAGGEHSHVGGLHSHHAETLVHAEGANLQPYIVKTYIKRTS